LAKASDTEIATAKLSLRDAQAAIAREYGFESWSDLKQRVTELSQSDLVEVEATENAIYTPQSYTERIRQELGNCLIDTNLSQGEKFIGKVRDRYDLGDRMALITTDRQSAFDRVLATRFGVAAIDAVHDGRFGQMVALRGGAIELVSLREATARPKPVGTELLDVAHTFFA